MQKATDSITLFDVMDRNVPVVQKETPLSALQEILVNEGRALVVDENYHPTSIITKIDLVDWMIAD